MERKRQIMERNQNKPNQNELLQRYFVRQRAYFDGYVHEIIDGHTNTLLNTYNNYDTAHKHCDNLNSNKG
jgi:hypothetical protein